jgi:[acyl-carrier-protein] S-malonyltransferase
MTVSGKTAWIFPGQGSQAVGMGLDLHSEFQSSRKVFEQADSTLSFSLSTVCFEGPEDVLTRTINTQPALLTVSCACLKAIEELNDGSFSRPDFVAGHSLGEYTACAYAGVFDFSTAVFLARERGRLMQEAGTASPGAMAAVLGMEEDVLNEICRATSTVIANFNSPGQLVISGPVDGIASASQMAKEKGAGRVVPLQVSGAFHSPLMKPARDGLAQIIDTITFRDPAIPVIANTTAKPLTSAGQIKTELLDQLCTGVQWQRSVEYMVTNGVQRFIEIGPGKVLTGLVKRINRQVTLQTINGAADIRQLFTAR